MQQFRGLEGIHPWGPSRWKKKHWRVQWVDPGGFEYFPLGGVIKTLNTKELEQNIGPEAYWKIWKLGLESTQHMLECACGCVLACAHGVPVCALVYACMHVGCLCVHMGVCLHVHVRCLWVHVSVCLHAGVGACVHAWVCASVCRYSKQCKSYALHFLRDIASIRQLPPFLTHIGVAFSGSH